MLLIKAHSLSIFSFDMRSFLVNTIIFFLPLVLGLILIENYLRELPLTSKNKSDFYKTYHNDVEILVLGASRNKEAINPDLMTNLTGSPCIPHI